MKLFFIDGKEYLRNNKLTESHFKGIIHLNTIFSFMKYNKICNLNHLLY